MCGMHPNLLIAAGLILFLPNPSATAAPSIDKSLDGGKLAEAEQLLANHLQIEAEDDLARFQLGTVRLLRAVERLAQDGSRHGTLSNALGLPFIRVGGFGAPEGEPEQVQYEDIRTAIARFQTSVAAVEATLAPIDATDLFWSLDLGKVALDLNGNNRIGKGERLDELMRLAMRGRRRNEENGALVIGLDSADAFWLRGYCHVLMSLADMTLAYDHQRMFDLTAHLFFANPDTKFSRERDEDRKTGSRGMWGGWESLPDLIAAIHLIDFKLREPRRLTDARDHLLEMVKMSRANWKLVLLETDNRNELIPNTQQDSIIPSMAVDEARLDAWQRFLDEGEAILNGEKLLPFWRSGFSKGVNLGRVFTEPRDVDLILWVQGTAALPYLEAGQQTDPAMWREFQRLFRGNFLGFAFWVN